MVPGVPSRINWVRERIKPWVDWVFSDELMIILALLLIPTIALRLLFPLSPFMQTFLSILNDGIIVAFILEYSLKLFLTDSRMAFVTDTWHVLDLFIIILALMEFIPLLALQYGEASPILRLLRVLRIFTAAGRSTDLYQKAPNPELPPLPESPMQIRTRNVAGGATCSMLDPSCPASIQALPGGCT